MSTEVAPTNCAVCATPSTMATEYVAYGGLPVCSKCANVIANIYHFAHSGSYLTWPNDDPRTAGYVKKPIPEELRWQVFERDGFACKHCGSRAMLRADHVIPEAAGGEATLENLQTLCHRCNSRKGKRT